MKPLLRILTIGLCLHPWLMNAQNVPQVQIVQLNMPLFPGDTAFESQNYPLSFTVQNVSPVAAAADTLIIFGFNTDTTVVQQEHILADTLITGLSQGMISTVFNPFFQFSSLNYKAGGNIVVVWPRLGNDPQTTFDSITVNIYFVPYQAALTPDNENAVQGIILNPSMNCIQFKTTGGFKPERVRIYDASGRVCFNSRHASDVIYLPQLSKGVYLIEWKNPDGRYARLKFVWP